MTKLWQPPRPHLWLPSRYRCVEFARSPAGSFAGAGGAVSSYVGPGDVVTGASHFYGLRAYSNADIGTPAIRLRRDNDDDLEDFVTVADGGLDVAAITTWLGANNAFVHTLYDQIGTDHLVQATEANQPPFLLTGGPGGKPTMTFLTASNQNLATAGSVTVAQPATWAIFAKHTNDVVNAMLVSGDGTNLEVYFSSTDNNTGMYAGTAGVVHPGVPESSYGSVIAVANGASSLLVNNGSASASLNPGTTGQAGVLTMGNFAPNVIPLTGEILEAGIWPAAFNSTQYAAMNVNQRAFWYVGIGDISAQAGYWGLRAYNAAARGSNCVRIRRSSDNAEQDFVTLSTGMVDAAGIATFIGGGSGFAVTLYDQVGSQHVTQATTSKQPQFIASAPVTSKPALLFVVANSQSLNKATVGYTGDYSLNTVYHRPTLGANWMGQMGMEDATDHGRMGSSIASADVFAFNGNSATGTPSAASAAWHTWQVYFEGAASVNASKFNLDGSDGQWQDGGLPANGGFVSVGAARGSTDSECFGGYISEAWVALSDIGTTPRNNLHANAAAFWGY